MLVLPIRMVGEAEQQARFGPIGVGPIGVGPIGVGPVDGSGRATRLAWTGGRQPVQVGHGEPARQRGQPRCGGSGRPALSRRFAHRFDHAGQVVGGGRRIDLRRSGRLRRGVARSRSIDGRAEHRDRRAAGRRRVSVQAGGLEHHRGLGAGAGHRPARRGRVQVGRGRHVHHVLGLGAVPDPQCDPQIDVRPQVGRERTRRALGGQHQVDPERTTHRRHPDESGKEPRQLVRQHPELVHDDDQPGQRRQIRLPRAQLKVVVEVAGRRRPEQPFATADLCGQAGQRAPGQVLVEVGDQAGHLGQLLAAAERGAALVVDQQQVQLVRPVSDREPDHQGRQQLGLSGPGRAGHQQVRPVPLQVHGERPAGLHPEHRRRAPWTGPAAEDVLRVSGIQARAGHQGPPAGRCRKSVLKLGRHLAQWRQPAGQGRRPTMRRGVDQHRVGPRCPVLDRACRRGPARFELGLGRFGVDTDDDGALRRQPAAAVVQAEETGSRVGLVQGARHRRQIAGDRGRVQQHQAVPRLRHRTVGEPVIGQPVRCPAQPVPVAGSERVADDQQQLELARRVERDQLPDHRSRQSQHGRPRPAEPDHPSLRQVDRDRRRWMHGWRGGRVARHPQPAGHRPSADPRGQPVRPDLALPQPGRRATGDRGGPGQTGVCVVPSTRLRQHRLGQLPVSRFGRGGVADA